MPDKVVDIPGVGVVSFPESMSDQEIAGQAMKLRATSGSASTPAPQSPSLVDRAKDVGIGFMKGAAHTAIDAGDLASRVPIGLLTGRPGETVGTAVDALYARPGLSAQAFPQAREDTAYANTTQRVGGALETGAELAIPVDAAVDAIPRAARAGKTFQRVMAAAKDTPVDVSAPGDVALRILDLGERGGTLPKPVNDFLKYVTSPKKPPMTYEVARDFSSNISRLSADEFNKLTPVVAKEVGALRVTLSKAVADAAGRAGMKDEYLSAMREFARAKKLEGVLDTVWTAAKQGAGKGLPLGLGAGVTGLGYWAGQKVRELFGE